MPSSHILYSSFREGLHEVLEGLNKLPVRLLFIMSLIKIVLTDYKTQNNVISIARS